MHRRSLIRLFTAALVLSLAGCGGDARHDGAAAGAAGGAEAASKGDGPAWATWDAGLARAREQKRFVVVDVYTDWCGWCKRMDADVFARADISGYLDSKFVSIKLDAESDATMTHLGKSYTARDLALAFGVSGYPTLLFLTPEGELMTSVPGYVPHEKFLLILRYLGDGHLDRGVKFEDYEAQAGRS